MRSAALIQALFAASAIASPLAKRQMGSDGVYTQIDIVTDIVFMTAGGTDPISTSRCTDAPAAATTTTPAAASSSTPFPTGSNSTMPAATTVDASTILPSVSAGAPPCPKPLVVDTSGQPVLIGMLGGMTLGACSFTATITQDSRTLISDSALLASTDFPAYSTAISSAAVTSTISAAGGEGQASSAVATVTSASVHALFTTPSAFASMATTLTKITAAPTFGAQLTAISVLATASVSVAAAQSSLPVGVSSVAY